MERRNTIFIVSLLLCVITLFAGSTARAEKQIGILMFSQEVRYNESRKGIMDQLKKEGFGEPAVRFIIENADSSRIKAADAIKRFSDAKVNLIVAIGTGAALAAVKGTKDIPVVFSTIYDPVEAGIAKDWKSSRNNSTGSSTRFPMSTLLEFLKQVAPIRQLIVLYTPGEKNSEAQLLEIQRLQSNHRLKVIPVILNKPEEVATTLTEIVHAGDAIYLTGSSVIGASVPAIMTIANEAKVITITHLDDLVEKGALLGVCTNSYLVGRLAGKKAVQILKGLKPSAIPIESEKNLEFILNMKTVKAGRFQIPPAVMKQITKIIE